MPNRHTWDDREMVSPHRMSDDDEFRSPDPYRYRYGYPRESRGGREPYADYYCQNCGSDDISPRRMSDDRFASPRGYGYRSRVEHDPRRDYGYDTRYESSGYERAPRAYRASGSGYEEPWHPGREREYRRYDAAPEHEERDFDDYDREGRAFRDSQELDYRLRERDHYGPRDEDPRRRW